MNNHHTLVTANYTNEDVALCAYLLWEKAGKPTGRDTELWLQAESELRAPCKSAAPAATAANGKPRTVTVAPKRVTRSATRAVRIK